MWPFVSAEQWAAFMASQGYDPAQIPSWPDGIGQFDLSVCELCNGEFPPDKLYLVIEPPPGITFGRKFHADCLISHFYLNATDMSDELINYALRKKLAP